MAELRTVFEMVTTQIEPDLDAWKEQSLRQRRSARSRKMRAMAVAAAVAIGAALFAARVLDRPGEGSAPATVEPGAPEVTLTIVELNGSIRPSVTDLAEASPCPLSVPTARRLRSLSLANRAAWTGWAHR